MKEIIETVKLKHTSHFPQKLTVNKIDLFDKANITHEFNEIFAKIGIKLAGKIRTVKTKFETYVETMSSTMESNPLYIFR